MKGLKVSEAAMLAVCSAVGAALMTWIFLEYFSSVMSHFAACAAGAIYGIIATAITLWRCNK